MNSRLDQSHSLAILASLLLLTFTIVNYSIQDDNSFVKPLIISISQRSQVAQVSGALSGLSAYYTFDLSTSPGADTSGNGHAVTLVNGTAWTGSGQKVGTGALSFDGINDSVLANADLLGTGPLSISMWIYPKVDGGRLVTNSGGKTDFVMDSGNRLLFLCSINTRSALNSLTLNSWNMVTVTRDVSHLVNFYVNGALSGPANQDCGAVSSGATQTAFGSTVSGASLFNGLMDDVQIYSHTLSSSEVLSIYTGAGGTSSSGGQSGQTNSGQNQTSNSTSSNSNTCTASTPAVGSDGVVSLFVDPTYSGACSDGTEAKPWKTFGGSAEWNLINAQLASYPVTVYFSARAALAIGDQPEDLGGNVITQRTDLSSHRLTLDGMSKYNTDDSSPSWADYSGANKIHIHGQSSAALGSPDRMTKQNNLTLRGFDVSGASARVAVGGDHVVVENLYVHDITAMGPAVQLIYATNPEGSCTETLGRVTDVTFRNNIIERTYGEAMYIGGTDRCASYGNSHSNILIENNRISSSGINGAQGDGIDLKDGLTNVTVRGNLIEGMNDNETRGIVAQGVYSGAQNLIIENNIVRNGKNGGIQVSNGWAPANGVIIRNNVVYGNAGSNGGISTTGGDPATVGYNKNVSIVNNTVYGNGGGITLYDADTVTVKNNLVFGNAGGSATGLTATINVTSDYNLLSPRGGFSLNGQAIEGSHSIISPSTSVLVVDTTGGNFLLSAGSPAKDSGVDLSSLGYSTDILGTVRPQGTAWDIGAYEYFVGQSSTVTQNSTNSNVSQQSSPVVNTNVPPAVNPPVVQQPPVVNPVVATTTRPLIISSPVVSNKKSTVVAPVTLKKSTSTDSSTRIGIISASSPTAVSNSSNNNGNNNSQSEISNLSSSTDVVLTNFQIQSFWQWLWGLIVDMFNRIVGGIWKLMGQS